VYEPGGEGGARDLFTEASALLRMPGTMGGKQAVVSSYGGKIDRLERNRDKGGWDLFIKDKEEENKVFLPSNRKSPEGSDVLSFFKKGREIKRGDILTDGLANPKDLLEKTQDMNKVQDYLTRKLGGLFADKGVLRRNVEGVVRSMTGTVEIADPGDSDLLPGQRVPKLKANQLRKQFKTLSFRPLLKGVDVAPREYREDFLSRMNYNNLRQVLTDSAQTGAVSRYHSTHPIPALAYGVEFNRESKAGGARIGGGKY
jgi:DNA-directed RNA polymerase subunit beta'